MEGFGVCDLAREWLRWEKAAVARANRGTVSRFGQSSVGDFQFRLHTTLSGEVVTGEARCLLQLPDETQFSRQIVSALLYDRKVLVSVTIETVHSRKLAAVRQEVMLGGVSSAFGPALGKVWPFIRKQPGLWVGGHNIFLYHHPKQPGEPIVCDFGVEVTRTFETADEVYATETPGGEAAIAVYRGPYDRMGEAHNAIRHWMTSNKRESAGQSWEIYGDPTPNPADTETTVVYLLK